MDDNHAMIVANALNNLTGAVETQFKMQQETNELIRALIRTLQETGQAAADLTAAMVEDE